MAPVEWYEHAASAVGSIVTAAALIAGGIWAFWRYVVQSERYPHIETAAEIEVIGLQAGHRIVEVRAVLTNRGKVEHKIEKFDFDLNALFKSDLIETAECWGGQVDFPHRVADGSFLPGHFSYFALGPGLTGRYSFIARVPEEATFLMLHCAFRYSDSRGLSHSMEKTIKLT
ncbi:MAG: hypothetical protein QOH47_1109 [Sphingomonadales bacterium]|nr:hypothetical protein [Sphingomonadales bacterium]